MSWIRPFNGLSAAHPLALLAKRHMHEYGTTREQLGALVLNSRKNAVLNERALYRSPLTMQEYLSARMITEPLCLYDCDPPIDGATVVIVSHIDAARTLRKPPLRIEAMSGALHGRNSWDQFEDLTSMAAADAGRRLWERTDLEPGDVDVANLYDGFSILALIWLEALGFCGKGESGAFVEGGARIALSGSLPLNTGGGQSVRRTTARVRPLVGDVPAALGGGRRSAGQRSDSRRHRGGRRPAGRMPLADARVAPPVDCAPSERRCGRRSERRCGRLPASRSRRDGAALAAGQHIDQEQPA